MHHIRATANADPSSPLDPPTDAHRRHSHRHTRTQPRHQMPRPIKRLMVQPLTLDQSRGRRSGRARCRQRTSDVPEKSTERQPPAAPSPASRRPTPATSGETPAPGARYAVQLLDQFSTSRASHSPSRSGMLDQSSSTAWRPPPARQADQSSCQPELATRPI